MSHFNVDFDQLRIANTVLQEGRSQSVVTWGKKDYSIISFF